MSSNQVEIRVGGKRYGGWKSVLITSSIEQVARAFALEVTENFPGNTDFTALQTGELVQVYIGEDHLDAHPLRRQDRFRAGAGEESNGGSGRLLPAVCGLCAPGGGF